MSNVYSPETRACFSRVATEANIILHEGVYAGLLGRNTKRRRKCGCCGRSARTRSACPPCSKRSRRARSASKWLGFSCLTNWAAGIGDEQLSHQEVLAVGKGAAAEFSRLLSAAL